MTSYWKESLMPMFREYLRDQYLCDLWFVCEGGALVPCHRLLVTALLGELSLLEDCPDEDCYVSLEGWPPEKLSMELEHLYWLNTKVTELQNIFKRTHPSVKTMSSSSDSKRLSSGYEFNISKKRIF